MLRRVALLTVLSVFLVLLSACSLPTSGTLHLPSLSFRPAAPPAPTSVVAVASPTDTVAVAVTDTPLATATPALAVAALSATQTSAPIEIVNVVVADTPTLAGAETGQTFVPTAIVLPLEPETPALARAATVVQVAPTVVAEATSSFFSPTTAAPPPVEAVPPVSTVIIVFDTPTPEQSSPPTVIVVVSPMPAPTEVAPVVPTKVPPTAAPVPPGASEIVWVDDTPTLRQSKLMVWSAGVSHQLTSSQKLAGRSWIDDFTASPDGAWVAYTTENSPLIRMINTQTGEERQLAPSQPGGRYVSPAWSPDGNRLSFMAFERLSPWVAPFQDGLWTAAPDGKDLQQAMRGLGWSSRKMVLFGWSPNGQELIYGVTDFSGRSILQWLAVAPAKTSPSYLPLAGTLYDIAPDGSWLLGDGVTPLPPTGRQDYSYNVLMSIPVDGKAPRVLTPRCQSDIAGQISPDGTRIAFLSLPSISPACPRVSGPLQYELWVANTDGSGRVLIDGKSLIGRDGPQWSKDGQLLYYSVWEKNTPSIWQAAAHGASPPTQLPGTEGVNRFLVAR